MGKLAGAALTVAAPAAMVPTTAAAAASGGGRQPKKITPGMKPGEVNDELQRRRQAAAAGKADTAAGPVSPPAGEQPAAADPPPAPSGAGPSLPAMPAAAQAAASTGSGILLGLFTWGLVLSYLGVNGDQSGAAGVRAFLAAKFLNKV
jgi:hypothetical protein